MDKPHRVHCGRCHGAIRSDDTICRWCGEDPHTIDDDDEDDWDPNKEFWDDYWKGIS